MEELPPLQSFASQLKECRGMKDLGHARNIYMKLCNHGLDLTPSIGNYIVPMLVDCGAFEDARVIFSKLPFRNEHSWSSSMRSFIEQNQPHSVFAFYEKMQEEAIPPTPFTLVPLLQACGMVKGIQRGRIIHSDAICKGFDYHNDVVLGNSLIDMYVKCSMMVDAHCTFDHMQITDLISWNTLISGYAEEGFSEEAMSCYQQMLMKDILPDTYTFACMLKVCAYEGWIELGRNVHAKVVEEMVEESIFVGSALVDMYAQCSLFEEAWYIFDEISEHDVVLWTSLMAIYIECDLAEEALACFELMLVEGIYPDGITLTYCLKACGILGLIDRGKKMHEWIMKRGIEKDVVLGNSLVYMYARCGSIPDSRGAFEKLDVRDVISWTSLIGGYVECDLEKEALDGFDCMQLEGISPNSITYVMTLRACCNLGDFNRGLVIHTELACKGLDKEPAILNALLDFYKHCNAITEVLYMFHSSITREVSTWNTMISACADHGLCEEALSYLDTMEMEGLMPNPTTYGSCLLCCSSQQEEQEVCERLYGSILKKGFERDIIISTALVSFYASKGSVEEFTNVFDMASIRDVITWNALIGGYVQHGHPEEALNCTHAMQQEGIPPDVVSWNMVFLGFLEQEDIYNFYAQMEAQGVLPDNVIFVTLLRACGNDLGSLEIGKRIHAQISQKGTICGGREELINTLIDMYGKCGSMSEAQRLFNVEPSKLLFRWNALMMGYARQGANQPVLYYFHRMKEERIQPDELTFLSILTACSHYGSVKRGQKCFKSMIKDFRFPPTIRHLISMIDLLGRAGQLDEAMESLEKIHPERELIQQHMLLDYCQNLGETEFNRKYLDHALMTITPHHLSLSSRQSW